MKRICFDCDELIEESLLIDHPDAGPQIKICTECYKFFHTDVYLTSGGKK